MDQVQQVAMSPNALKAAGMDTTTTEPLWNVSGRNLDRSNSSDFPSTRQHPRSSSSTSSTLGMMDVGALMREQDADLLESIHNNGPNQTGTTPVLTSQTPPSSDSRNGSLPPPLSLFQETSEECNEFLVEKKEDEEQTLHSSAATAQGSSPMGKQKNHLLPFLIPTTRNGTVSERSLYSSQSTSPHVRKSTTAYETLAGTSSVDTALENGKSIPSEMPEKSTNRRMLSGEIFQDVVCAVDAERTAQESTDERSRYVTFETRDVCDDENVSKPADTAGEINTMRRCESKERRMNEAAQFAEVVGDVPLTEQKAMRIIDYGDDEHAMIDDDDDDDDDATEIHVQKRSSAALLLKPTHPAVASQSTLRPSDLVSDTALQTDVSVRTPETPIKSRPQWPTEQFHHHLASRRNNPEATFLAQLPSSASSTSNDFVYKGIRANPPDIVKRGTTRGNYAQLHRKAWLEVSDKYHRYGKNLRLYYRFWEKAGCPTNMFFDWLDSKGEAAGQPLPELAECPRSQLDSDTVLYIANQEVTQGYAVRFVVDEKENEAAHIAEESGDNLEYERLRCGRVIDVDGDPVRTGPDGWIFVLRDNVMYGAQKITSVSGQSKQRFHHSSFFGGKAVAAAGIFITDDDGYLTRLYPHSGHYRPGEAHMQRVLFYIYHEGVDLRTFEIDTQQIVHVARENETTGATKTQEKATSKGTEGKKKKIESLHLMPAVLVACFLAHKARFIGEGVFSQIHQIRKTSVTSVSEALTVIDNGGFWRHKSASTVNACTRHSE